MTPHLSPDMTAHLSLDMTPSMQVSTIVDSDSDSESDNIAVARRKHKKRIITDSDSDSEFAQETIPLAQKVLKSKLQKRHIQYAENRTPAATRRFIRAYWKCKGTPEQRKEEEAQKLERMRKVTSQSSDEDCSELLQVNEKDSEEIRDLKLKHHARLLHLK